MNDFRNIILAWTSSIPSLLAAIESREFISMISAVVLPVIFFAIGKSIDVAIQIYFRRRMFAVLVKKKNDEITEIHDRVGGAASTGDADTLDRFGDQAPEPRTRKSSGRKTVGRSGGAKRAASTGSTAKRSARGGARKTADRNSGGSEEAGR